MGDKIFFRKKISFLKSGLNIHIANRSPIMDMYIKFINENFDINKHLFIFLGKKDEKTKIFEKYPNVKFTKNLLYLEKMFLVGDKIFIHSFFNKKFVKLFAFNMIFFRKSYWIAWGGDIYSYLEPQKGFKNILYENIIRTFIIKNIGNIVTLTSGDFNILKERYKTNSKYYEGLYPFSITYKDLDNILSKERENKGDIVKILVGNSGDRKNNYEEIFDILSKFKDENIEIYTIFSYGSDKDYIKKMEIKGREIFGEKFKPMFKFLTLIEYANFLNGMDIFISNHKRQQAMGNINLMLYLGKKVYLRENTSMWNFFNNGLGSRTYNTQSISSLNFKKFLHYKEKEAFFNRSKVKKITDPLYAIKLWKNIFKEI